MPRAEDGDLWAQSATKVQHLHCAGVLKLTDKDVLTRPEVSLRALKFLRCAF